MKKLILTASFAFTLLATSNTFAQQGFGTNQPDKSAAVDIVSSKRGLLIPRVALTSTDSNNLANNQMITAPANSLFVYNTQTAGNGETAVKPGFYYWERFDTTVESAWQGKWVRFTSSNNEKKVIVNEGENVKVGSVISADGLTTTYTVGVLGGSKGQVLVSDVNGGTVWTDPDDFLNDILTAGNGLSLDNDPTSPTKTRVKLGGDLTEDTSIDTGVYNLSITGLDEIPAADLTNTDKIVIMDLNGVLKITSKEALLNAKNLTLGDGLAFESGDGVGAVLKETKIEILDKSVVAGKLDGTGEIEGHVATVKADGSVDYEAITPASITDKKMLKGEGITVTAGTDVGTDSSVANALLADVTIGIANGAVTAEKMSSNTIVGATTTPVASGFVPVADGAGNVTYQNVSTAIGKDLTTDGKIIILNNPSSPNLLENAVLVETELAIAPGSISPTEIKAPGTTTNSSTGGTINQVMVTDENGNVSWIKQSDLKNKDSYTGIGPISITENGASTNGKNYDVSLTPGTSAGLVLSTVNSGTPTTPVYETGWVTPNSVIEVENGLYKKTTDNIIRLGGALTEVTKIEASSAFTLAIKGLEPATENATNKVVVSEGADGILRTVERVVKGTDATVASNSGYSLFTPEVILDITLPSTGDVNIVFPEADEAVGQVINIKIANTNENHSGYLNVLNTYGSMPHQAWVVKSNGAKWEIIARN